MLEYTEIKTWTIYVYGIKRGRSSLLSLFCLCYVTISDLFFRVQHCLLCFDGANIRNNFEICKFLGKKASERLFHDVQNGNHLADDSNSNYKEIIVKFFKMPT